jgi:type III restriction enzyme
MGRANTEKSTIIQRLINGAGSVPPIPVVWGISATVQRFTDAVQNAKARTSLPNVVVDSAKVQESGLLKDTIVLDIPDQVGDFDTVLLRRGTEKLKEITEAWKKYANEQGQKEAVVPLMVFQVPNTPNPEDLGRALDTIFNTWGDLDADCVAHVFGDHTAQTFGRHIIQYIEPQRVQETPRIRVLIAKDAISTGWDCPRAEVMVSFRAAVDKTHITQLLGRMVRTPLARRIPGDEKLNSVECLLPKFDKKSVVAVAEALMQGGVDEGDSNLSGRKILIKPIEVHPNPAIEESVWEVFESLPSQSLPKAQAKPIKRLTALAQELAMDGLLENAGKSAHAEMHRTLDAAQARFGQKIEEARKSVEKMKGQSMKAEPNRPKEVIQ